MIHDNDSVHSVNDRDSINSSQGNVEDNQQNTFNGNDLGNTTFTQEEIENANKPQPNVILNTVSNDPVVSGTGTRDNMRVNERANEASDSTDTNTGGIVAGGAKGASQS
jgi:hypothetical protein